jgi:hypothetical protein
VQSRTVPVYRSPDIIRNITAMSLLWERYFKRMGNKEMPKRVKDFEIEGSSRAGRPKFRWMSGVVEYRKIVGFQRWWIVARDSESWRRFLRETKVHSGL